MSNALGSARAGRAIRNDQVLGRDKDSNLSAKAWVKVDLLERSTGQAQVVQHALVLWAVLGHLLCELEVHVITNPLGCIFFQLVDRTNDLRLDRTCSGECLDDGL